VHHANRLIDLIEPHRGGGASRSSDVTSLRWGLFPSPRSEPEECVMQYVGWKPVNALNDNSRKMSSVPQKQVAWNRMEVSPLGKLFHIRVWYVIALVSKNFV
jgi:hypothetical protein